MAELPKDYECTYIITQEYTLVKCYTILLLPPKGVKINQTKKQPLHFSKVVLSKSQQ
jgi:hypothetical protein